MIVSEGRDTGCVSVGEKCSFLSMRWKNYCTKHQARCPVVTISLIPSVCYDTPGESYDAETEAMLDKAKRILDGEDQDE